MRLLRWALSYIVMSGIAIGLAFYLTSAVMSRSQAQTPEASAPPEVAPPAQLPPAEPTPAAPEINQVPNALLDEAAPVQQTAVSTNPDDFVFDPTGMRDPFKPYKAVKPPEKGLGFREKSVSESIDPLQNLDIETLELVAVLWDVKNPRALVKTKSGNTYTIKRDTKIGRNNGVVAGIREGEVIILEVTEEDGRPFKQYKTIKMATIDSKINKVFQ